MCFSRWPASRRTFFPFGLFPRRPATSKSAAIPGRSGQRFHFTQPIPRQQTLRRFSPKVSPKDCCQWIGLNLSPEIQHEGPQNRPSLNDFVAHDSVCWKHPGRQRIPGLLPLFGADLRPRRNPVSELNLGVPGGECSEPPAYWFRGLATLDPSQPIHSQYPATQPHASCLTKRYAVVTTVMFSSSAKTARLPCHGK